MFAIGLIVFRETLEAALFIGIMAAATRLIPRRSLWIVLGVLAGVVGALALAWGMGAVNQFADGQGQELLQVVILGAAFIMLTWHVVWASQHGKELASKAKLLGQSVKSGQASLMAVAIAIAMIVLREGAETVLFVSGSLSATPATVLEMPVPNAAQLPAAINSTHAPAPENLNLPQSVDLTQTGSAQNTPAAPAGLPEAIDLTESGVQQPTDTATPNPTQNTAPNINTTAAVIEPEPADNANHTSTPWGEVWLGVALGLLAGVALGVVLYFGLSRIPLAMLFRVTNALVVVLAAGMAGQMANRLVQMGVLPDRAEPAWDVSAWLSNESAGGMVLNALMGYDASPSVMHVTFFGLALVVVVLLMRWGSKKNWT